MYIAWQNRTGVSIVKQSQLSQGSEHSSISANSEMIVGIGRILSVSRVYNLVDFHDFNGEDGRVLLYWANGFVWRGAFTVRWD